MTKPPAAARRMRAVRGVATLAVLSSLAACGTSHHAQVSAPQEAAQYAAKARHNYTPPGPPGDPWGPYIVEASNRFDVPDRWIRGVMRQESGGQLFEGGKLITSGAGAMGLMQVMPDTYDELRARYALGDDPYDPHDNILAGTAYMRELYDLYGTPAFLAAYNAGPKRLDDYLSHHRPLPDETRNYVARIGPGIAGVYPQHVSAAQQYAVNQIPVNIPPGPRRGRSTPQPAPVALASTTPRSGSAARTAITTATLPPPPPPVQLASGDSPPKPRGGFHLIQPAVADTLPAHTGGPTTGAWAIQVGAYVSEAQARSATVNAKSHAHDLLASAQPYVGTVHQPKGILYRARLTGLSRDAAIQACEKLSHHGNCMVVSPDAQS